MTAVLAERLKTETRALHSAAERSAFMVALLRGQVQRRDYGLLLSNLHAVYAVLEPALVRHAQHPLLAPVHLPALWRTPALELDLNALHGPDWRCRLALMPVTGALVTRLHALAADEPERLLSHAYVRFLGDLSGGQILRRIVARSAGLGAQDALNFYDFGDDAAARALATRLRSGIEQVPDNEQQRDAIVDEARMAFEWHLRLFDELASGQVVDSLGASG